MTEATTISIQDELDADYGPIPARPPPSLTLNFRDLRDRFHRVTAMMANMSSGYQEGSQYIDELHYQRALDALTDQLHDVCMDITALRVTCSSHLKLKLSALLYLLPEEADTELRLTKSLLADLEAATLAPVLAPA